jgi:hypothetical protein
MNSKRYWLATARIAPIVLFSGFTVHAASPDYPVAGLAPYQRPVNAPVQVANHISDMKRALHGVSSPIPDSLKFLHDQGGWFNPFIHPGMTGPYDLRGWHSAPPPPAAEKK